VSTNLQGNEPVNATGTWSLVSGAGRTVDDVNDPTTLFTGVECEFYTLKWTIANPCGSTSDSVNIYFDTQPTTANAGTIQLFNDNTTTTTLAANTPQMGEGVCTIQNGQGGSFEDASNPITEFTGQQCQTYILRWTISTPCHTSYDEVQVKFDATPTTANAGEDQSYVFNTTTVLLEGNAPAVGEGTWSMVSGQGGSFDNVTDPNTEFSGQQCQTYTLKWEISTPCHESFDEVSIEFNNTPTVANAGPDQWYVPGTSTTLEGNSPENGLGYWSIVSGSSGTIQFPTNPNSIFIGQQSVVYELKWTISTECNSPSDNVSIYFGESECGFPLIDSRDEQLYETVQIGDQCWMAENLAYLPEVSPSSQGNNTDPFYYVYNYQGTNVTEAKATANYHTYGVLYNWPASLDACPEGWHLPATAEWTALKYYMSSQPEYLCNSNTSYIAKALDATNNWNRSSGICVVGNNLSANNATGFTGLPGSVRSTDRTFGSLGNDGYFWSSSCFWEDNGESTYAIYHYMLWNDAEVHHNESPFIDYGFSEAATTAGRIGIKVWVCKKAEEDAKG